MVNDLIHGGRRGHACDRIPPDHAAGCLSTPVGTARTPGTRGPRAWAPPSATCRREARATPPRRSSRVEPAPTDQVLFRTRQRHRDLAYVVQVDGHGHSRAGRTDNSFDWRATPTCARLGR